MVLVVQLSSFSFVYAAIRAYTAGVNIYCVLLRMQWHGMTLQHGNSLSDYACEAQVGASRLIVAYMVVGELELPRRLGIRMLLYCEVASQESRECHWSAASLHRHCCYKVDRLPADGSSPEAWQWRVNRLWLLCIRQRMHG